MLGKKYSRLADKQNIARNSKLCTDPVLVSLCSKTMHALQQPLLYCKLECKILQSTNMPLSNRPHWDPLHKIFNQKHLVVGCGENFKTYKNPIYTSCYRFKMKSNIWIIQYRRKQTIIGTLVAVFPENPSNLNIKRTPTKTAWC